MKKNKRDKTPFEEWKNSRGLTYEDVVQLIHQHIEPGRKRGKRNPKAVGGVVGKLKSGSTKLHLALEKLMEMGI